ncbi:MAG: hypothetical protein JNL65_04805 [Saprospiraceae bacterium]|nr:hypothetical protein [Saprospiraceae bacterium]
MIAQNLIVYGSFTTGTKTFFSGGQFGPDYTGQFRPDRGGQFAPDWGGQFKPDRGGQLSRIFQILH